MNSRRLGWSGRSAGGGTDCGFVCTTHGARPGSVAAGFWDGNLRAGVGVGHPGKRPRFGFAETALLSVISLCGKFIFKYMDTFKVLNLY